MLRILIPATDIKKAKNLEQLETCLESIQDYNKFQISVAWDSCSPEFIEYFNSKYRIDENIINSGNRLNFARNVNLGLRKSRERKETVLLLNQDTKLRSDQGDEIAKLCSIVGLTNLKACNDKDNIPEGSGGIEELPISQKLAFYATIIHSEVLQKIGLLEGATIAAFEDDDYCVRAKLAEFKLYVADRYVYHQGSYIDSSQPGWESSSGSYNQENLNFRLNQFMNKYRCNVPHDQAQEWILANHKFENKPGYVID